MQRDQNGADIPDKPLFVKTLGIVDSYPVGCPIPYPGPVAPDGYLLMDGRAFSKTLYPQLAKLYVDGVLPDMRGMYVRGWDNGGGMDSGNYIGSYINSNWLTDAANQPTLVRDGSVFPKFGDGKYSPRGYEMTFNRGITPFPYHAPSGSTAIEIKEGKRGLLTNQYFDSVLARGLIKKDTTTTFKRYYFEQIPSPTYASVSGDSPFIAEPYSGRNDLAIGLGPDISGGPGFTRYFTPTALIANDMIPLGVPNVAFNYITKAA